MKIQINHNVKTVTINTTSVLGSPCATGVDLALRGVASQNILPAKVVMHCVLVNVDFFQWFMLGGFSVGSDWTGLDGPRVPHASVTSLLVYN